MALLLAKTKKLSSTVLALETIGKWPGTNSNRCVGAARSTRAACGPRDHLSGAAIGERVNAKHAVSWLAGALAELHASRWTLSDELFDNPLKNPEGRALPVIPRPAWGGGSDAWSLCLEGTDLTVRPQGTPAGGGEGCRRIAPLLKRAATYVSEDEIGQAGNLFHDFQIYFRPAIVIVGKKRHSRKLM